MTQHELRFRIPHELYKKYKVVCTEMDISIPRQCAKLIEQFVIVQEENIRLKKSLKNRV